MNALPNRIDILGEMTIAAAAELRRQLLAALAEASELDVDLSQVSEIDSAGMQLLVAAKREASAQGKLLRFTNHSAAVFYALELCKLTGHLGDPVLIQSQS